MKKIRIALLFCLVALLTVCLTLAACSEETVKQLTNENGITVEGDGFSQGATLVANKIESTDEIGVAALQAIADKSYDKTKSVTIYDISVQSNGVAVQPSGKVKVTMSAPIDGISDYIVFHIKNGEAEEIIPVYDGGKISFETSSFSPFVIAATLYPTFSAFAEDGGEIYSGETDYPDGYYASVASGTSLTLTAKPSTGYAFKGWYEKADDSTEETPKFKDTPVSALETYEFTTSADDYSVYALFFAQITSLSLDGADAGFIDGAASFEIGVTDTEDAAKPQNVKVYGVTVTGNTLLEKDTDYTIDESGLDYSVAGVYTITYTLVSDTEIKGTLTVNVEGEKYLFEATIFSNYGDIYLGEEKLDVSYCQRLVPGTKITLTAKADDGYDFVGWFEAIVPGQHAETAVSTSATYEFTSGESDYLVYVVCELRVIALQVNSTDAGFNNGAATYIVGANNSLDLTKVVVKGMTTVTTFKTISLVEDTDYTVDEGELDLTSAGIYTITYTYLKNTELKSTLTVEVIAIGSIVYNPYDGEPESEEYNGGTAAHVDLRHFTVNGAECDNITEVDGISYEWRDHDTGAYVYAARDVTIDDQYVASPAVTGTYDFVLFATSETETKIDLATVTKTITTNQFALATSLDTVLSGTNCNVIVGTVYNSESDTTDYYVMAAPGYGKDEIPAIKVVPEC